MEIKCQSFKTFDNLLETNQLYKKLKSQDPAKESTSQRQPKRKEPKTEEQKAKEANNIANDFLRDLMDDFGFDLPGLPPKRDNNSFVSNATSVQSRRPFAHSRTSTVTNLGVQQKHVRGSSETENKSSHMSEDQLTMQLNKSEVRDVITTRNEAVSFKLDEEEDAANDMDKILTMQKRRSNTVKAIRRTMPGIEE